MKRVALCLFLAGCAPSAPTYHVYIDSEFTAYQRIVIQESLKDWTDKSNGLVTFHPDMVESWGTKVTSHTIKSCYAGAAGCTVRDMNERLADSSRIYLPMDREFGEYFPSVVRHEIGHSLGLAHEPDSDLMMAKILDPRSRVTCKDVNRLDVLHSAPYSCNE
jgi:hypothetical protein